MWLVKKENYYKEQGRENMSKYRLFKNKRTKYHPSIEISVLEDGTWENIEITDSPTLTGNYEEFDVNPNPNSNKKVISENI